MKAWKDLLTPNNVFNFMMTASGAVALAGTVGGFPSWLVLLCMTFSTGFAKASRGVRATKKRVPLLDTSAIDGEMRR